MNRTQASPWEDLRNTTRKSFVPQNKHLTKAGQHVIAEPPARTESPHVTALHAAAGSMAGDMIERGGLGISECRGHLGCVLGGEIPAKVHDLTGDAEEVGQIACLDPLQLEHRSRISDRANHIRQTSARSVIR